ncbi:hypothetical protein NCAS_0B04110 [Naumovozyma castellii]|uniref:Ribosomal RNA-processing protein 8 n=1 Tax=Naumovozyma castellii TaxID=27288 RepID=G0VA10_NAUCA|nr:hypothetical protein NCAS_0B04110 [Naumovozyma castellii CBS 4309]CCC68495.1 hypothetical protein NCAS_0B04110 [Naumovozyma castellii CBS 4309]
MELFKVAGWDLKTDKVAFAKDKKKKNNNTKQKKKPKNRGSYANTIEITNRKQFGTKPKAKGEKIDGPDDATEAETVTTKETETPAETETKVGKNEQSKKRKQEVPETENSDKPVSKVAATDNSDTTIQPMKKRQLTPLQQKMMAKLTGSRFRWINEQFYTISSEDALGLVKKQPELFDEYHDGFRSQVQSWPENPVNVFVDQIKQRSQRPVNAPGGLPGLQDSKKIVIADMGCGEAQLALDVDTFFKDFNKTSRKWKRNYKVHSFDLKRVNKRITVADIRNVPLPDDSCTIVIFCLSLMGTNFLDFIKEAYRILAPGGELWIAEIKSRFGDGKGDEFVNALKLMGFFHKKTDDEIKCSQDSNSLNPHKIL